MRADPWHNQVLTLWVPLVLRLANLRDVPAGSLQARVRAALADVLAGGTGLVPGGSASAPVYSSARDTRWLPRVGFRLARGRVVRVVEPPQIPDLLALPPTAHLEEKLHAVVMALAGDPRGHRLRCCDWEACRAFFLARANHRRAHSFCCDDHRRAFELEHRDKQKTAAYMQTWRAERARRRARKGGKRQ